MLVAVSIYLAIAAAFLIWAGRTMHRPAAETLKLSLVIAALWPFFAFMMWLAED